MKAITSPDTTPMLACTRRLYQALRELLAKAGAQNFYSQDALRLLNESQAVFEMEMQERRHLPAPDTDTTRMVCAACGDAAAPRKDRNFYFCYQCGGTTGIKVEQLKKVLGSRWHDVLSPGGKWDPGTYVSDLWKTNEHKGAYIAWLFRWRYNRSPWPD